MSNFRKEFEKAVLDVAAEINAMDDAAFAQMLDQHREGDIVQILQDSDFFLASTSVDMMHATFAPKLTQPVVPNLGKAEFVKVAATQPYAWTSDEWLPAA